jgi:hypothetical protein
MKKKEKCERCRVECIQLFIIDDLNDCSREKKVCKECKKEIRQRNKVFVDCMP